MGQALAYDIDAQIISHTVPLPPTLLREVTLHWSRHLRLRLPVSQTMQRTQAVLPGALLMVTRGNHSHYSALKSGFLQLRCGLKGHQLGPDLHPPFPALPSPQPSPLSPLCPPRCSQPERQLRFSAFDQVNDSEAGPGSLGKP